jgi:hypothetical protein
MERIDLGTIIQDSISKFNQNRIGDKPSVFVTLSPALTQVPWKDRTLKEFLRFFLYEALLTSDPDAPVEITLRRRFLLADLKAFVGVEPSYWVQVRISGRGLRIAENLVEDLFTEVGYRCEEWVGIDGSEARLGIFGSIDAPRLKMVFCIETKRHKLMRSADPGSRRLSRAVLGGAGPTPTIVAGLTDKSACSPTGIMNESYTETKLRKNNETYKENLGGYRPFGTFETSADHGIFLDAPTD